MNPIKRALLYVTRKKGKSILLFAILLTMSTFILTGLSIRKASETAQLNLRQSLGAALNIYVDWENSPYVIRETIEDETDENGMRTVSFLQYSTIQLTPKDIAKIKEIPGVKHCSARFENLVPLENLSLFSGTIPTDEKYRHNTKIFGVCDSEDDLLFTSGTLTLTSGRHISDTDYHKAIISADLAEKNYLKIGDYITVHRYSTEQKAYTGEALKIKITGLFTANTTEQFGEVVTTYDKIQNRVFVDLKTAVEIDGGEINYGFSDVSVTIDDPRNTEQIINNIKALPEFNVSAFTIISDNEDYENASAPLSALSEFVTVLLAIITAVSAIILALILTLWTKSRIHETGVLLSVGFGKLSIIGQYLTEVLLIALIAFGLSFWTSSAAAGRIGDRLLEQSTAAADNKSDLSAAAAAEAGEDNIPQNTMLNENVIEVKIKPSSLLLLYIIGFLIIIIAVTVSSVSVMRLKPKNILSEMN